MIEDGNWKIWSLRYKLTTYLNWANILLVACNKQDNPPDNIRIIFLGTLITSNGAMSAEGKAIAPMKIACIFGRISKLVPEAAFN